MKNGLFNESLPVVDLVDNIIKIAIERSASDIHLESMEDHLRVRFRLDGMLCDQPSISQKLMHQIISRIKILSNIDIAQKRIPQDGKFKLTLNGHLIDLRISTFPSVYGEKVVIRILDRSKNKISLDEVGFDSETLKIFKNLIKLPTGFILVTGPTGSGKTTTLYSCLSQLHTPEKNIITLEDPVEYHIDGVTQGQIHPESGFTFAKGIKSLLRQDPDIAMIGEIRDKESAKIAIEAALTGHLVFSTLHTNNAPGAIMRLMDMDIEPFLINASLTGVLAQRLVRKICLKCTQKIEPTYQEKALMDFLKMEPDFLLKGAGCSECDESGYKGRTGVFELLVVTDDLRSLIVEKPKFNDINFQAIKDGMKTLLQDATQKVQNGIITLQELVRVVS